MRSKMGVLRLLAVMLITAGVSWQLAAKEIAHYTLRDGQGTLAAEKGNKLPPGKIRNSFWMKMDGCKLMDFGGMKHSKNASVELPKIDFTGEFSIAIWVRAYWWQDNWAPIVFRSDNTYGLRNNKNNPGQLHFRVKDKNVKRGANLMSDTILERNRWYHIAVTFTPGKSMRLYINGRLDAEMTERIPQNLAVDKNKFRLGGTGKNNFFAGTLSDLHFYDHALTEQEIMKLYRNENRFGTAVESLFPYPEKGKVVATLGKNLKVYSSGALALKSGNNEYRIDSIYSYPDKPVMNFNAFTAAPIKEGEKSWQVKTREIDNATVEITAAGSKYSVKRLVKALPDGRVNIKETFTNITDSDQGLVFFHRINPQTPVTNWNLYGQENAFSAGDGRIMSANPTIYIAQGNDAVAIVAEDDIFRCHLNSSVIDLKKGKKRFDFGCRFGIPAGKSHTLEYTLYSMKGDYFDFLNRLRKDWKVPVLTLNGPYGLVRTAAQRSEVYRAHLADENKFRKAFERRNMKIITLNPWFHYWDGTVFATREEFKKHMQQVMKNIRKVNPEAKFLASLETYTYCLGETDFSDKADPGFSWTKLTDATVKRVMNSPWRDSATPSATRPIGLAPIGKIEGTERRPGLNLKVHPVRGNHFYKVRMEEFDFLIDEVGFDGIYQDMFGFSAPHSVIYNSWDGFTVALKPDGTIANKMTHLAPLTAPGRADWLRKIIGKGKIALTNFGAPTTRELQTIPYYNFCEAAGRGVGRQNLDSIPPDSSGCVMNQLSTPLAYGPHRHEEIDAVRLMARVRAYLRYGCLYIHTSFRNSFPETGPNSGEYGPINHMYPITPVELHRGWVKGKERIVSCVSYKTLWNRAEKPAALRFDAVGRAVPVKDAVKISGKPGAWQIEVKINDWKEFLILE